MHHLFYVIRNPSSNTPYQVFDPKINPEARLDAIWAARDIRELDPDVRLEVRRFRDKHFDDPPISTIDLGEQLTE